MNNNRGRTVSYIVTFIILIGLLVFAIMDSRSSTGNDNPTATTNKRDDQPVQRTPREASQPDAVTEPSGATSPSTPAPTPRASTPAPASGQQANRPQTLVRSGPGETLALFVIVAGLGTTLAYTYQLRSAKTAQ